MSKNFETFTVRPDSKGRITLGKRTKGISSYRVEEDLEGRLVLIPFSEIPTRERWLWKNKSALESVQQGLEQSARGEKRSLGSFAKYAESNE